MSPAAQRVTDLRTELRRVQMTEPDPDRILDLGEEIARAQVLAEKERAEAEASRAEKAPAAIARVTDKATPTAVTDAEERVETIKAELENTLEPSKRSKLRTELVAAEDALQVERIKARKLEERAAQEATMRRGQTIEAQRAKRDAATDQLNAAILRWAKAKHQEAVALKEIQRLRTARGNAMLAAAKLEGKSDPSGAYLPYQHALNDAARNILSAWNDHGIDSSEAQAAWLKITNVES